MAARSIVRVTATHNGRESSGSQRNALEVEGVRKDVRLIEQDGDLATIYVNGIKMDDLAHYEQSVADHLSRQEH